MESQSIGICDNPSIVNNAERVEGAHGRVPRVRRRLSCRILLLIHVVVLLATLALCLLGLRHNASIDSSSQNGATSGLLRGDQNGM